MENFAQPIPGCSSKTIFPSHGNVSQVSAGVGSGWLTLQRQDCAIKVQTTMNEGLNRQVRGMGALNYLAQNKGECYSLGLLKGSF